MNIPFQNTKSHTCMQYITQWAKYGHNDTKIASVVLILLFRSSLQNNFNVDTHFSIFSMRFVSKVIAHSDKKMNSGQQFSLYFY